MPDLQQNSREKVGENKYSPNKKARSDGQLCMPDAPAYEITQAGKMSEMWDEFGQKIVQQLSLQ